MFKDNLDIRWVRKRKKFKLLEPFSYVTEGGEEYIASKNFLTDGASIPKIVWSIVGSPWTGRYVEIAVIHDWLCYSKIVSRRLADKVFLEGMKELGVSWWKRKLMYRAVRAFSIVTFKNYKGN